jgi:3-oxoadipate enol-lactonase
VPVLHRRDDHLDTELDLDFDVRGEEGPPVVQLHGLTSSRAREDLIAVDLMGELGACRVLRYDARGHGRSTGPRDPRAYGWPSLAEDLLALVDHVFPGEPVHGVGSSMGSGTLLHAAPAAPERWASLTLCIPPTAWGSRVAQGAAYEDCARVVETQGVDAIVEAGRAAPHPPAENPDKPVTWPDVALDLLPTVFRGAALTDMPDPPVLAGIDLPTLLLAWVEDPAHPLSTAEALHALLPRSELVVARTHPDVRLWPGLVADLVHAGEAQASDDQRGRPSLEAQPGHAP